MSNPVFINLEPKEYADVVRMGVEQTLDALLTYRKGSHGISVRENESYDFRIQGALGEYVVASYLKLPWLASKHVFSAEDLPGIDVKTASEIGERLIIRDNVEEKIKLVLVTPGWIRPLNWIIWGWITAEEGRRIGWRTNFGRQGRESVWAVPHTALYDIRDLRALCDLVIPFGFSEDASLFSTAGD